MMCSVLSRCCCAKAFVVNANAATDAAKAAMSRFMGSPLCFGQSYACIESFRAMAGPARLGAVRVPARRVAGDRRRPQRDAARDDRIRQDLRGMAGHARPHARAASAWPQRRALASDLAHAD